MRPLKFVLLLLFGAAVLITFLKLLMFVACMAFFGGFMYLLWRAFGWRRYHHMQHYYRPMAAYGPAEPLPGQQAFQAEPIVPNYRRPFADTPFARTITVQ